MIRHEYSSQLNNMISLAGHRLVAVSAVVF